MAKGIIGSTSLNSKYISSNIPEVIQSVEEDFLELETEFKDGAFVRKELEMIARNLESTAVYYGEKYGLAGSKLLIISEDNLKAVVDNNSIKFFNKTKDDYQRHYAGFVEYGHDGVPPRPFMRSALYSVAKISAGDLGKSLENLLRGRNSFGEGTKGVSRLSFGKELGQAYFSSKPNNQVVRTLSNFKNLRRNSLRPNKERKEKNSKIRGKSSNKQTKSKPGRPNRTKKSSTTNKSKTNTRKWDISKNYNPPGRPSSAKGNIHKKYNAPKRQKKTPYNSKINRQTYNTTPKDGVYKDKNGKTLYYIINGQKVAHKDLHLKN